jgi:hypothetical protein
MTAQDGGTGRGAAKVRMRSNAERRGDELRYAAIRDQSATEGMLACDISASPASR